MGDVPKDAGNNRDACEAAGGKNFAALVTKSAKIGQSRVYMMLVLTWVLFLFMPIHHVQGLPLQQDIKMGMFVFWPIQITCMELLFGSLETFLRFTEERDGLGPLI